MSEGNKKRVLFFRRLRKRDAGTNGGNLKLRDCFNHFAASADWEPVVCFPDDTVWYEGVTNLWSDLRAVAIPELNPEPGDLLFFSGHDWTALPQALREQPPVPVLNIAQPRHVRKQDGRQQFLDYPAIRIAKSHHGARILRDYGVRGPLYTIPDTIDLAALPRVPQEKDIDVLVLGLKQPGFAREVGQRLEKWSERAALDLRIHVQLPPKLPTRRAFLELLARAKIVACVPLEAERGGEGFYLPALEAMALETLVVCPHSIGNVDHCLDGKNCIVPDFSPGAVAAGVQQMYGLSRDEQERLRRAGLKTARAHDLPIERAAILELADNAYDLWSNAELFLPSARKPEHSGWLTGLRRFFGR